MIQQQKRSNSKERERKEERKKRGERKGRDRKGVVVGKRGSYMHM